MNTLMLPALTFAFIASDFISGAVSAMAQHEWSSSKMRQGLYHKFGSIILIFIAHLIDYTQNYADLGIHIPVASAICVYIILMELGSVLENIGKINPQLLPTKIRNVLGIKGDD